MRLINVTRHGSSELLIVKEQVTHVEQIGASSKRSNVDFVGGGHVEVAMTALEFAERINVAVD